jgi:hypothetical protein
MAYHLHLTPRLLVIGTTSMLALLVLLFLLGLEIGRQLANPVPNMQSPRLTAGAPKTESTTNTLPSNSPDSLPSHLPAQLAAQPPQTLNTTIPAQPGPNPR